MGAGLTAPHLLDVAVGVVPPQRAGMASGAANTFFPLGTATGVAVYGAVLAGRVDRRLPDEALAGLPISPQQVRALVAAGRFDRLAALPQPIRQAARTVFTDGLSTVFTVAGIAGLVAAVAGLLLIRAADQFRAEPEPVADEATAA
ncbi:hypothetical protein [Dactylosporangium sp. CA-092794]|uniref:hypothetical protein n=1 Tax=Dactylosporangium sp. CA-092794 TaxID=3239929 RepID=UPI003D8AE4EA